MTDCRAGRRRSVAQSAVIEGWSTSGRRAARVVLLVVLLAATAHGEQTLRGRILDAEGRGLSGAEIRARLVAPMDPPYETSRWTHTWQVLSDSEGMFQLSSAKTADADWQWLDLEISAEGLVDVSRRIGRGVLKFDAAGNATLPQSSMESGRACSVRVFAGDMTAVADALVLPHSNDDGDAWFGRDRTTDREGRATWTAPFRRDVEVLLIASEYAPQRVLFPKDGESDLTVTLTSGRRVVGTLVDVNGLGLPDCWMLAEQVETILKPNSMPLAVARKTDATGRFEFPPLDQTWKVSFRTHVYFWPTLEPLASPAPFPAVRPVVLDLSEPGAATEVRLQAVPKVTVRGRVVDDRGKPVSGKSVGIQVESGNEQTFICAARTDDDGRYLLDGIPAGSEHVWLNVADSLGRPAADGTILKAKPATGVQGARWDGQVYWERIDTDQSDIDFAFRPFKYAEGGFLGGGTAAASGTASANTPQGRASETASAPVSAPPEGERNRQIWLGAIVGLAALLLAIAVLRRRRGHTP